MTKLNDKEIEELFKSAPDDAEYYHYLSDHYWSAWIKDIRVNSYQYIIKDDKEPCISWQINNRDITSTGELIPRPIKPSTPIYTKEFNVRGGLNIESVFQPCEILFEGNKYIIVRNSGGKEFARKRSRIIIRDIDTRTDVEKAKDDLSKLVGSYATDFGIIDAIINNKIHGVTFTGSK